MRLEALIQSALEAGYLESDKFYGARSYDDNVRSLTPSTDIKRFHLFNWQKRNLVEICKDEDVSMSALADADTAIVERVLEAVWPWKVPKSAKEYTTLKEKVIKLAKDKGDQYKDLVNDGTFAEEAMRYRDPVWLRNKVSDADVLTSFKQNGGFDFDSPPPGKAPGYTSPSDSVTPPRSPVSKLTPTPQQRKASSISSKRELEDVAEKVCAQEALLSLQLERTRAAKSEQEEAEKQARQAGETRQMQEQRTRSVREDQEEAERQLREIKSELAKKKSELKDAETDTAVAREAQDEAEKKARKAEKMRHTQELGTRAAREEQEDAERLLREIRDKLAKKRIELTDAEMEIKAAQEAREEAEKKARKADKARQSQEERTRSAIEEQTEVEGHIQNARQKLAEKKTELEDLENQVKKVEKEIQAKGKGKADKTEKSAKSKANGMKKDKKKSASCSDSEGNINPDKDEDNAMGEYNGPPLMSGALPASPRSRSHSTPSAQEPSVEQMIEEMVQMELAANSDKKKNAKKQQKKKDKAGKVKKSGK